MPEPFTYLNSISPFDSRVGYGQLGAGGDLGYEGKQVSVQGRPWPHALSTHAPARLLFRLDGSFRRLESLVALNDDTPSGVSSADFSVMADGRLVAAAPAVAAGGLPRPISGEVGSAKVLELIVNTSQWDHCHSVWLDPRLFPAEAGATGESLVDCVSYHFVREWSGHAICEWCRSAMKMGSLAPQVSTSPGNVGVFPSPPCGRVFDTRFQPTGTINRLRAGV